MRSLSTTASLSLLCRLSYVGSCLVSEHKFISKGNGSKAFGEPSASSDGSMFIDFNLFLSVSDNDLIELVSKVRNGLFICLIVYLLIEEECRIDKSNLLCKLSKKQLEYPGLNQAPTLKLAKTRDELVKLKFVDKTEQIGAQLLLIIFSFYFN